MRKASTDLIDITLILSELKGVSDLFIDSGFLITSISIIEHALLWAHGSLVVDCILW